MHIKSIIGKKRAGKTDSSPKHKRALDATAEVNHQRAQFSKEGEKRGDWMGLGMCCSLLYIGVSDNNWQKRPYSEFIISSIIFDISII